MMRVRRSARLRSLALLVLVMILLLSSLSSCAYSPIEPTKEDLTVVGKVGERDVYLEELRFVAHTYRSLMISRYGDRIFEGEERQTYIDMLCEQVYKNITANYATIELCSESLISMGEEAILARVDEYIEEMVNELGGMRKYKKYLAENHATDHFLRFSTEVNLIRNELLYVYVDDLGLIESDDEKLYDIIEDEFIKVQHIFVSHGTEGAYEKIQSAYARASAGEDFDTLINELDEDPEMTADGIFILEGYMTEEYEKAAFSLKSGKTSEIVTDELGYYVIKRQKLEAPSIWLNFSYLKELYQTYTFYGMIDERQAMLTFVPNQACEDFFKDFN